MQRNGRKWTIGYKFNVIEPTTGYKKEFELDIITDEGGGTSRYVFPYSEPCGLRDCFDYLMQLINEFFENCKNVK